MTKQKNNKQAKSFRGQLTTIFTVGILALGLAGALSSAWITKVHIEDQLFEDGLKVTESLAKQSILALIYDSADNAEDAAVAAMGFPAIERVAILNVEGETLLAKGKNFKTTDISNVDNDIMLMEETIDHWLFAAPVFLLTQDQSTLDEQSLLLQTQQQQELRGYVLVQKSKKKIGQVFTASVVNNIGIGLLFTLLLLAFIHLNFNRLVTPLDKLAAVMGRAEEGDTTAYASLDGPKEVIDIARAYNKMIEALAQHQAQLKRHNEILEYEVEARTRDLVYARDMAIQANRNKSHFLSNVSHELRTPLQSILGYSDLILETLPEDLDDIRHDIDTIVLNAENLLHMINSVLDMSKIEAGRIEIKRSETDLEQILEDVVETIKPLMIPNHNQLEYSKQIQQRVINIDKDKLRQIILNLLSNAAKFTHNGTIYFSVEQTPTLLKFQIKDSGIGMNQDQVDHIFEPFFQIDASNTRRYQGTGLGLAITNQFCQLMGGEISVKSSLNQGSTFDIQVPYD